MSLSIAVGNTEQPATPNPWILAERSLTARTVVDFCRTVDRQLRVATNNAVDLKIVVALGFAGLALMQIGVTAATPMWVTLAIFALNHLAELNLPDAAASSAAD